MLSHSITKYSVHITKWDLGMSNYFMEYFDLLPRNYHSHYVFCTTNDGATSHFAKSCIFENIECPMEVDFEGYNI